MSNAFTGAHTVKLIDNNINDLGTPVNPLRVDPVGSTHQPVDIYNPAVLGVSSAGTAIITNTNTLIIAAPGVGFHIRIHSLWAQNSSATGTWCYWGNGSGVKSFPFYLGQNQPFSRSAGGRWALSTNTGLYLNTTTTGVNIEWFVEYEIVAD